MANVLSTGEGDLLLSVANDSNLAIFGGKEDVDPISEEVGCNRKVWQANLLQMINYATLRLNGRMNRLNWVSCVEAELAICSPNQNQQSQRL